MSHYLKWWLQLKVLELLSLSESKNYFKFEIHNTK
jgi:hypothetical protein